MSGFLPPLSRTITSLIYFADYAEQEYEPVLDERMIVYNYTALDPATMPEGYITSEEYQVLLSRFLYVDLYGADYRYDITYGLEMGPNVPAPVSAWLRDAVVGRALPALERQGHLVSPYVFLRDDSDPAKGQVGGAATPRFSNGYTVLQHRPCFVIETHMLKDYPTRVRATYDTPQSVP